MKRRFTRNTAIVLIFVLALALPIFHTRLVGSDYSEEEKRYLAPLPQLLSSEGGINSSAGPQIKAWLEDHIGFRSFFAELSGKIKLNIFHQSPSTQVHIGKDGWYYYTLDENLEIATGDYPMSDETLEQILREHLAVRDKLREQGIDYVILLPTSKVSIYPEYVRYGSEGVRRTPVDMVADYLEQNSDLKVVRLKDALLDAKSEGQVFYKTDTHWTQFGAYTAYRRIIEKMNEWGLCKSGPAEVVYVDSEFTGEFGAMMGSSSLLEPEKTKDTTIIDPKATKNEDSERYQQLCAAVEAEGIHTPMYHYDNPSSDGPAVMMYGDSMFGSWNATELLAENFSELTYVWDNNIRQSLLSLMQPDLVIYEMTERYLNTYPTKNADFLREVLSDCRAEILSWQMTDEGLEVTVKNTSDATWTEIDQVKCCMRVNGDDSGWRAPVTQDVGPGEETTLLFSGLTELPDTRVELQMLQEGIRYFGEREVVSEYPQARELGLAAQVISHDAPAVVDRTGTYNINITVQNTGTAAWSEPDEIRLCIWQDRTDYGYHIALPDGVSVMPGEEYTFTLENFVAPPGNYTELMFQMVKEGVCYFGESEPTDIYVS